MYILEVLKWQVKRYAITFIIASFLVYLGYTSYYKIHIFSNSGFVADVVFEAIVMGFLGSLFFLAFLFSLKPNIKIADDICYNPKKNIYYFKMVNMSLLFPIKDVKIAVDHCRVVDAIGDGSNVVFNSVKLKNNSFTHVNSILGGLKNKVYAFIVQSNGETIGGETCINDVLGELEHNYIQISVYAKHSLSGFSIQKRKVFKNHQHIDEGEYATGIDVDILPLYS